MIDSLLDYLAGGLFGLSLWQTLIVTLVLTQITIAAVTIYLHRHQAHRALELHPGVSHFFRFWLWLTTGMVTRQWVAVHRKHHAYCERDGDPHSPSQFGIGKLVFDGVDLYRREALNEETVRRFGKGTPDDWLERNVYARFPGLGVGLMLALDVALLGVAGLTVWALQMLWIPFWAAGVINGLAHWAGYRNYETPDQSTNLLPLAIWVGGEELHNNHHAFSTSAKFSSKWWELDIGWLYIRLMAALGLATVKRVAPKPRVRRDKQLVDRETVRAVLAARVHVMAHYGRQVVRPVLREAVRETGWCRRTFKQARVLLMREQSVMDERDQTQLETVLQRNQRLQTVYQFRLRLQEVWGRAASSQEALRQALRDWCAQAEASGIQALQEFARSLRGYSIESGPSARV